ncbi:hypothetical protein KDC22_13280 [Paenibacillus tritici]|uniref:hypothetical protein n=1 Tax=Paenibacillus tritici TaxID=1873425 RepID=UPI001BAC4A73|nr:hypothetical protein [Paenibacillus tritici]QUL57350.1 hypothetical protein KDC22_13280 [Paenibacillus tritici]
MKYELGEITYDGYGNKYKVGDFRKNSNSDKEYWNGERWIEDFLWSEDDYTVPFLDDSFENWANNHTIVEPDNPFYQALPRERQLIAELKELTILQQDTMTEIKKRQDELFRLIGGAKFE